MTNGVSTNYSSKNNTIVDFRTPGQQISAAGSIIIYHQNIYTIFYAYIS